MPVYNLCRICLTEDTRVEDMYPLFEEKNENCVEIIQKIEECSGILLKANEEFPKLICRQCLDALDTSYKFRSLCRASENALLDSVIKAEYKTESVEINTSPRNSQNECFEIRTEFINAEVIDSAEIAEVNEDTCEQFTDIEETSNGFIITTDGENSEIEFLEEDEDDQDVDYVHNENEDNSDYVSEDETYKKRKAKNIKKSSSPRKRGRPRSLVNSKVKFTALKPVVKRERKKNEDGSTSIMCEICGNIYTKQNLLNMHMRRHLAYKPYECEICGKTFACSSEIRRHMRVHTGERPYVCKFCGRTFKDRSTNIKHERIHTNERPFTCATCGKSFTYSNVLKNHMLTHTGEKPFSCFACKKTFSRKHQLDQHCSTLTHQQRVRNLGSNILELKEEPMGVEADGIEGELLGATAVVETSEYEK